MLKAGGVTCVCSGSGGFGVEGEARVCIYLFPHYLAPIPTQNYLLPIRAYIIIICLFMRCLYGTRMVVFL